MEFLFNVWKRIRDFDFKNMTPTQWVLGLAGGVLVLWIVAQILSVIVGVLNFVAPIALLTIIGYFGYQYLQSREEDIPAEAKKSGREKEVEQAVAHYRASLEENLREDTSTLSPEAQTTTVADENAQTIIAEQEDVREVDLIIEQKVNPETGFKEPDIARLIEHEEQKLSEADKVTDDIMAQIEARRRRLNQGGE